MKYSPMNFLILFLCIATLNAASQDSQSLLDGKFVEIREFSPLNFTQNVLEKESQVYFEGILATVKSYSQKNQNIKLQVLGYSNARVDIYDKVIATDEAYKKTLKNTVILAQKILQNLVDNGLTYKEIDIDYKNTKSLGFNSVTKQGKDLSNHVIITMYIFAAPSKVVLDTDNDGILDDIDAELDTPQGYVVDALGRTKRVNLAVSYKKNSTKLSKSVDENIMKLKQYLTQNPELKAHVVGHTSKTDVSEMLYNTRLSLKRAKVFTTELIKYGIDITRLSSDGKGFSMPIADNKTSEGRMKNRRIEVQIIR
jgi:outer membrane protein OmpA-like peptidoglycan-associated protein